jgi:uncharacterized protein
MRITSPSVARRLALTAQGLDRPRPGPAVRRDVRHLRRVADAVDIVQLDSVNVLLRAHELPFWSRIGPHDRAARDAWLWGSRELYEGWIHVASCTSVDVWPLLHHRRAADHHHRRAAALATDHPDYLDLVLEEVRDNGPTTVQDLVDPGSRDGPWWGHPKGKTALDLLHRRGDLAVHTRTPQFVTVYDLTERVLPAHVLEAEVPPRSIAHRRLIRRAAGAHGIATAHELADHHRLRMPDARAAIAGLVADGELEEVRVRGLTEVRYALPGARAARTIPARTLLSPFDPVVWHRARTEALFGFRYRIEIYVPEADRVHGYYVLPFLLGEELVARVDLKADRAGRRLLVRGAFAEPGSDRVHVARELAAELRELATWLGLTEVAVGDRGDLAAELATAAS